MFLEARVKQIKWASEGARVALHLPGFSRFCAFLGDKSFLDPVIRAVFGYRRIFKSLAKAEAAARPFANGGHLTMGGYHLANSERARPSDYALLFHLSALLPETRYIFDFGGNLGNLYYCYRKYAKFRDDLVWKVYDLKELATQGRQFALEHQERQLEFCDDWRQAEGADVFIASGSLHYFATPLAQLIRQLKSPPRYIFVNRTPLVRGETAATVQDAGPARVACALYNSDEFIAQLTDAGYDLVDQWSTPELTIHTPMRPQYSAQPYSGLYFRIRGPSAEAY